VEIKRNTENNLKYSNNELYRLQVVMIWTQFSRCRSFNILRSQDLQHVQSQHGVMYKTLIKIHINPLIPNHFMKLLQCRPTQLVYFFCTLFLFVCSTKCTDSGASAHRRCISYCRQTEKVCRKSKQAYYKSMENGIGS